MSMSLDYSVWRHFRSPFLFPESFEGHACEWETFASARAGCLLCAKKHECPSDECVTEVDFEDGHSTCLVTGTVVATHTFKEEWGSIERTYIEAEKAPKKNSTQVPQTQRGSPSRVWDFVHRTVCELLDSDASRECRTKECERLFTLQTQLFHKAVKKTADDVFPNLLEIIAFVAYQTRKLRKPVALPRKEINKIAHVITDSVTNILLKYNRKHLFKLMNNYPRKRDFVCSMVYLSRVGVNFHGEVILPRIREMVFILPLESFLPTVFNVRSKSITEGENLLKIELREWRKNQSFL